MFRWQQGRQVSGYEKMLLATAKWPIPFDIYLLKFGLGARIDGHTDKVEHGEHHRLNIVLKKAKKGGEFLCLNPIYESSRIKYFRPDVSEHAVTEVEAGCRYVLSIGWLRKSA